MKLNIDYVFGHSLSSCIEEQEDDLISRREAIEEIALTLIHNRNQAIYDNLEDAVWDVLVCESKREIPKKIKGTWKFKKPKTWIGKYMMQCSNCGGIFENFSIFNYCPMCGSENEIKEDGR